MSLKAGPSDMHVFSYWMSEGRMLECFADGLKGHAMSRTLFPRLKRLAMEP